jgi:hypothetical protein
MKSFKEYITESKRTYAFKIKVAGDLPENFSENLRAAVSKFSVANLSKGKTSPIQGTQQDFPLLKNESVTVFDAEVHYPTTSQVLQQYICDSCKCRIERVRVQSANESAREVEIAEYKDENSKPLIGSDDTSTEDAQKLVGETQKMSMLKDLMKEKHMGEQYKGVNDAILAPSSPSEKSADMPKGTSISPIGSKARKGN